MDKPVDIGAMPLAGPSKDGRVIFFDFQGNDGNLYRFKVTHEAVPQIVETLIRCAAKAEEFRGDREIIPGQSVPAVPFPADSFVTALLPDGSVSLIFQSPGRPSYFNSRLSSAIY